MLNRHVRPCLTMVLMLQGCFTSWQPQNVEPAQLLTRTGETEVQVRLVNGNRLVLRDPGVEGDSLVGWQVQDSAGTSHSPLRRAFALADVQQLATHGNAVAPNVAFGAVTGAAIFIATIGTLLIIYCSAGCD